MWIICGVFVNIGIWCKETLLSFATYIETKQDCITALLFLTKNDTKNPKPFANEVMCNQELARIILATEQRELIGYHSFLTENTWIRHCDADARTIMWECLASRDSSRLALFATLSCCDILFRPPPPCLLPFVLGIYLGSYSFSIFVYIWVRLGFLFW